MTDKLLNLVTSIAVQQDEIQRLFKEDDVQFVLQPVCSVSNKKMGTKLEVHVYSGIRNLAEKFGAELVHPVTWYDGREETNKLAFVHDGVLFFELGKQKGEYEWK